MTQLIKAYPLSWPEHWPRTPADERHRGSPFKVNSNKARKELIQELNKLGAEDVIISSNAEVRNDGMPYADAGRRSQKDPGIAVYFTMDGKPSSMARDLYTQLDDNLRCLGLAVRDMRSLQLHGGDFMMKSAFSGFTALPPPPDCWKILGLKPMQSGGPLDDRNAIIAAHRERVREASADSLNGSERMAAVNAARDDALKLIG